MEIYVLPIFSAEIDNDIKRLSQNLMSTEADYTKISVLIMENEDFELYLVLENL